MIYSHTVSKWGTWKLQMINRVQSEFTTLILPIQETSREEDHRTTKLINLQSPGEQDKLLYIVFQYMIHDRNETQTPNPFTTFLGEHCGHATACTQRTIINLNPLPRTR